jgi:seryl-tRNA synthetase
MLDIKFIRENKDIVAASALKKRFKNFNVEELISLDDERISVSRELDELRAKQNKASDEIAKASLEVRDILIKGVSELKEQIKVLEDKLSLVMKNWRAIMLQVPNVPDMSVPYGESDEENQEYKRWGDAPVFNFTPRSHIELLEMNDMVDFERGTKTSGFRGYFLKGDAAILEMAVWQYVMLKWQKKGFTPMLVPSMVKSTALYGSGYLPQGEEDLYKDGDDYLSGTGEVATMFYHSDEVVNLNNPIKYISWSPCFRKEAGSHGKDVKGLIRVHEFYKCEQVVLCKASHEESVKIHEEITRNSEELMEELGLHYRNLLICTGDLGLGQVKKYDIEAWMPSQQKFRETHSASYFHDFQTRRLNIRYRDEDGKLRYAHSLNNTAAATPRLIAAIIENYQNEDGTIRVPEVLIPFTGKSVIGNPVTTGNDNKN